MRSMALEINIKLRLFGPKRTILFPEGCTYLTLNQAFLDMFDWDHDIFKFVIGPRTISDGSDGSEDMVNTIIDGSVSDGYFKYNDFVFDFNIKICDRLVESPIIISNEGLFPIEDYTSEEWNDIIANPYLSQADMEDLEHAQSVDGINNLFRIFWKPTPILKGRVGYCNGIIIIQALMMGLRGLSYDFVADQILYNSEPSDNLVPISPSDSEELMEYVNDFANCNGKSDDESLSTFIRRNYEEWLEYITAQPSDVLYDWASSNELYVSNLLADEDIVDIIQQTQKFFEETPFSEDDYGWFGDSSNN